MLIRSKVFQGILSITVSALFTLGIIRYFNGQWQIIGDSLINIKIIPAAIALSVYFLGSVVLSGIRMGLVYRSFGIYESYHRYFIYTLIGLFFSAFLPSNVAGDIPKAALAAGKREHLATSFLATFVDRAIALLGVFFAGSIGLFLFNIDIDGINNKLLLFLSLSVISVSLLAVVIPNTKRCRLPILRLIERSGLPPNLTDALTALIGFLRDIKTLFYCITITFAVYAVASMSLFLAGKSIGINLSLLSYLIIAPAVTLISLLPTVNGIGLRETVIVLLLGGLIPAEKALALSIIYFMCGLSCSLMGGLIFIFRKKVHVHLGGVGKTGL